MMALWTQEHFEVEVEAWKTKLRENKLAPINVSEEFSQWTWRKRYIVRRFTEFDVHVVYSMVHRCPSVYVKCANPPKLGFGFVGSLEYHPITDEVVFFVHACETRAMMDLMMDPTASPRAPGVALLSWWSIMANGALQVGLNPELFSEAIRCLEM